MSAFLRRKRASSSSNTEADRTRMPSNQLSREQKSAPHRHPRYEMFLAEHSTFMAKDSTYGPYVQNLTLYQKLLNSPQSPPKGTLFNEDLVRILWPQSEAKMRPE
jgi:hypothetical protein